MAYHAESLRVVLQLWQQTAHLQHDLECSENQRLLQLSRLALLGVLSVLGPGGEEDEDREGSCLVALGKEGAKGKSKPHHRMTGSVIRYRRY